MSEFTRWEVVKVIAALLWQGLEIVFLLCLMVYATYQGAAGNTDVATLLFVVAIFINQDGRIF